MSRDIGGGKTASAHSIGMRLTTSNYPEETNGNLTNADIATESCVGSTA